MNRLHLHFSVWDLESSREFYSRLFCSEPEVVRSDYLKWTVDNPPLNFALSTAKGEPGFKHAGIESEDANGFLDLRRRAEHTGADAFNEDDTECCYARSDKTWISDPDGVAWELFQTHERLPEVAEEKSPSACGCNC